MSRIALLFALLFSATWGCGDDGPDPAADTCGERPARCECADWECQYGDCALSCFCDPDTREWREAPCDRLPPDAGVACPNAIASDEGCGNCVKQWGAGASYCAASCAGDDDCAGMTSAWGDLALVCHPGGYCTRSCTESTDCALGDGVDYACDDGRCSACIDCF